MSQPAKQVWLVRHADTEWSRSGRHTGITDLPLLAEGEQKARDLAPRLAHAEFSLVLSSPRTRALETARLAGFGSHVEIDSNLAEFDYGQFEGLTSDQIHARWPGWDLWRDGCPGGESPEHVAARCARLVQRCIDAPGHALLFGHGHIFHAFAAAWLELPASRGRSFGLKAGSISVLGFEHGNRVLWQWDRVERFEGH
jgi:broad specificity phosphatase PhoE